MTEHIWPKERFLVALSFPSEDREFVEHVAKMLAEKVGGRKHIFYDKWYEVELAGIDGDLKLKRIYEKMSDLVVPFFSKHYEKPWCKLEWGSIRSMLINCRKGDAILAIKMDDCHIPGWNTIDFHINLEGRKPEEIAELIYQKIKDKTSLPSIEPNPQVSPIVYDSDIPIPGSKKFRGREEELKQLTKYLENKNVSVVEIVAPAGIGKTNLISEWLIQLRPTYNDSRYVFFWTFYIHGTTPNETKDSNSFYKKARQFFNLPSSDTPAADLAAKIQQQKTIIVLDGIEPLQSSPESNGGGKFIDTNLRNLLTTIVRDGFGPDNGLIVVTSRQPVVEIVRYKDRGYKPIELKTLSDDEGAQLLRDLEVNGLTEDLKEASRKMGGHCLALVLLGNLIRETTDDQNIASMPALPPLFEDPNQGGHALRIMQYYDQVYWQEKGRKELLFLRLLGLFDRPINIDEIDLIKDNVTFFQELGTLNRENTNRLYTSLKKAGLLSIKNERDPENRQWDTHALVRQYFGQLLYKENPTTWQEAHRNLFNYYQRKSETNLPNNLESMQPLYRAIRHGCLAHEYQAAFKVYENRIAQGEGGFSTTELGAAKEDVSALSCFFNGDMEKPATELAVEDHIFLLGRAAFCLKSIGQINRSIELRKEQIDFCHNHHRWEDKAESTVYLANTYLARGDLQSAEKYAKEAITLTEQCKKWKHKVNAQAEYASVLFSKGDLEGAKRHFHAAEELQREHLSSEGDYLHSIAGARYCSLLLARASTDDDRRIILKRAEKVLQWEEAQKKHHKAWKVAVALGHISKGRALMAMQYQPKKHKKQAQEEINSAVDIIRNAGAKDEHPRILLTRAHFYRLSKNYNSARSDLEEVYEIADRCDMDLYRVDYLIESGHLLLDDALLKGKPIQQNVLDEVKTNLNNASHLIDKQGYHLKDAELSMLQARLAFYENRPQAAHRHIEDGERHMNKIGYMAILSELKNLRNEMRVTKKV